MHREFEKVKTESFHDKYVKGDKLGEGQHASVFTCYKRAVPRSTSECTPLPVNKLNASDYLP
jgi:hypothetical protein